MAIRERVVAFALGQSPDENGARFRHATENAIVESSYLAPFLDTQLPHLGNELSCRDLQRAWCVLRDCASILASKCKIKGHFDIDLVERFALYVRREEIERAVSFCCKLRPEQARSITTFFTCDLNKTGELFTKGLWAYPLVPFGSGEYVLITLAAASIGSATRRIENWLDKGGLSDRLATARRGLRYEAWVREELASCISANALLPTARCSKNSFDRRNEQGEQIDLLVRLGGVLLVGEVKCLLAPIEPMERFNYLSKLNEAGMQAVRKASWVTTRLDAISDHLELRAEEAKKLRPIPIVVVNQGAGFGLLAGGARVIDFHFLKLYLTDGDYHAGMAVNFGEKRGVSHFQALYGNEREAEENFERVMAQPPTLKRFLEAAKWETTKFPMGNGGDLEISVCHFDDHQRSHFFCVALTLNSSSSTVRRSWSRS